MCVARSRMFTRPWCCPAAGRGRIEAAAVVLDGQAQPRAVLEHEADPGLRRAGVAGDVAQRLAGDLQELRATAVAERGSSFDALVEIDLDVDHGVQPQLVGQRREAADEVRPFEQVRSETEDEVADVADRSLDRVDRPVDPRPGLRRVLASISVSTSSSDRLTA